MHSPTIYICDDEPKILADFTQKVNQCIADSCIKPFSSGTTLMEGLREAPCDILLLDIDMPGISGMDVASWLMQQEQRPLLVFVTSHDELVYDSFQYHPFGKAIPIIGTTPVGIDTTNKTAHTKRNTASAAL